MLLYLPFLTLLVGWALGLVGPTVQDKIKNHYKSKRVLLNIKIELSEIRSELAQIAFILEVATGKLTKKTLVWIKRYAKIRVPSEQPIDIQQTLTLLEQTKDEDFVKVVLAMADRMKNGVHLRTLAIPYTQLKLAELELISEEGCRHILEILSRIRIFNQLAEDVKNSIKLTFDPKVSPESISRIQNHLLVTNTVASSQARRIIELVELSLAEFGS